HWTAACGRSSTASPRSPSRRARMRASLALLLFVAASPAAAQPPARNTQVDAILAAISATSIEARIRKLASFRTRHTLSRTDSDPQGLGADDDASGVAAVMEMACSMAFQRYDATLVFMAVAGEEQGLLGSTHWAELAKSKGWNIAGMISNDIIGSPTGRDGQRHDGEVR